MTAPTNWDRIKPRMIKDIHAGMDEVALAVKYRLSLGHIRRKRRQWVADGSLPDTSAGALAKALAMDLPPDIARQVATASRDDTAERNARILAHRLQGRTFGQIASDLRGEYPGLSRGAVASVVTAHLKTTQGKPSAPRPLPQDAAPPAPPRRKASRSDALAQLEQMASRPRAPKVGHVPNVPNVPDVPDVQDNSLDVRVEKKRWRDPRTLEQIGEAALATTHAIVSLTGCAWPSGDMREHGIGFCDAPAVVRKVWNASAGRWEKRVMSYCERHLLRSVTGRKLIPISAPRA